MEVIFLYLLVISIIFHVVFGVIGDYFSCKTCRMEGYLPGDEEHMLTCYTLLFSWNIGIFFFWLYPLFALSNYIEYKTLKHKLGM